MNIYKVEFKTVITVDNEGRVIEDVKDMDLDDEEDLHNEVIGGSFYLGAYTLAKAFLEASDYLDEAIGEDEYEITTIKEKMNVVNWPGEDEPCDCPSCRTNRAAEEDKIKFKCKGCGTDIIIIDDFDEIQCPSCGIPILRDRILGANGNYVMLDIDKLPKKPVAKKEPTRRKSKPKGGEDEKRL